MEAKLLEEKLEKEKEKEKEIAEKGSGSEHVPEVHENQNEVSDESIDKPTALESFSTDDGISYTPCPIRVPTEEPPVTDVAVVSVTTDSRKLCRARATGYG